MSYVVSFKHGAKPHTAAISGNFAEVMNSSDAGRSRSDTPCGKLLVITASFLYSSEKTKRFVYDLRKLTNNCAGM